MDTYAYDVFLASPPQSFAAVQLPSPFFTKTLPEGAPFIASWIFFTSSPLTSKTNDLVDPSGIPGVLPASIMEKIGTSDSFGSEWNFSHPFKNSIATTTAHSATTAPRDCTRVAPAFNVPPVARRSSISITRSPARIALHGQHRPSVLYSVAYSTATVGPGSFPGFLSITKGIFSARATGGPRRNPRLSNPATTSIFFEA
mmetsp:Transcript_50316/g.99091  ORF Transcript_50316/g.99091 Transcript_50316/m.99091 type:complete len:200 (-) Transcript_50316:206-805(-)